MFLTPSSLTVEKPELDESFDDTGTGPSSVSPGFPHLVSINCDISKQWLAFSIKSHKLWVQTRVIL